MGDSQSDRYLCLFCGRRADSKEHVWPEWIGNLIAEVGPVTITLYSGQSWRTPFMNMRVTGICGQHCNNGWMSRMEKRIAPLLTPMLTGFDPVVLNADQQAQLAAWAWKSFLTHSLTHPVGGIPGERYPEFYSSRVPPDDAVIWIGACALVRNAGVSRARVMEPAPDGRFPESEFFAGVFGALHVFFNCYLHLGGRKARIRDSPRRRDTLSRIWPIRDAAVTWPPQGFWYTDSLMDDFLDYDEFF